MKDFLGWFQAGGVAAILAVVVSLYKMRIDHGEKVEANEAAVTIAVLQGLQNSVNQLSAENLQLRQYINSREESHRNEMDELRATHRADIESLKTDYERQISALRREFDRYRKEHNSTEL